MGHVMSTGIEWTDETWNPVTGCDKVSPGCDHCYAETIAHRFDGTPAYPNGFKVTLHPERLERPLHWTRPRMVFVNSMSDMFHADIPDEYITRVFAVMALAPQHTFQILTKRHARMKSLLTSDAFKVAVFDAAWNLRPGPLLTSWPLPNVWLGVSAEDQRWANLRIPALLHTPAAIRFVSAEPLLGPIDLASPGLLALDEFDLGINWVIVGGESGNGARPMAPDWVRSLRDQCDDAGVAFFFKQWGGRSPKANGKTLDGRTHLEFPQAVTA
jgi:protein gp37